MMFHGWLLRSKGWFRRENSKWSLCLWLIRIGAFPFAQIRPNSHKIDSRSIRAFPVAQMRPNLHKIDFSCIRAFPVAQIRPNLCKIDSRCIRAFPVAPIRWNSHNIDSSYMFLHKPVTSNTVAVSWGAGASNRGARSKLSLGATCELISTSQNLGSRSISNLVKMLIGQFPTPLRSGRLYSNLENCELGPILTHLKPGRPNSNILEVVTELNLIFSNTL